MESVDNRVNLAEEFRKIWHKLESLSTENGQLRADVESMKEKNSALEAKMVALEAHKAELMNANTREMLAKLKVVELEAKLASEQMTKAIETKMTDMQSKTQNSIDELSIALTSKIEEGNAKVQNNFNELMQESQRKCANQIAENGKKVKAELDRTGERLEDILIEMRGKMADLETQIATDQNKQEEFAAKLADLETNADESRMEIAVKLANLEAKADESRMEMRVWKNNRWFSAGHVHFNEKEFQSNNFTNWISVRAHQPISRALLASSIPGRLVYYEVRVKTPLVCSYLCHIGWIAVNCLTTFGRVGCYPGTFAINQSGNFWNSHSKVEGYGKKLRNGDVVGSGLLLTEEGHLKMFFTKNGKLNGEPLVHLVDQDLLLYAAASFSPRKSLLEVNFGTNPGKPFQFDLDAHAAQLLQ